jgi:aminopeptidase N
MKKLLTISFIFLSFGIFAQKSHSDIIDVQEYTINLSITSVSTQFIGGFTNVRLKPVNENTNTILLDLLQLEIDSITCDESEISQYTYNDTLITISLVDSFGPTEELNIKVYYHGDPVTDPSGWGGFYFMSSYAFNLGVGFEDMPHCYGRVWFPCNDDFIDRASYTTIITTLSEHTAVCAGEMVSMTEDTENNLRTWEWRIDNPIPTYLASVAVGSYKHLSHIYEGIDANIPVDFYIHPSDSAKAAQSFVNIDTVLSVFEAKFGPYAWNRVGYVSVPFGSGAMEHVTNIAMGRGFIDGSLSFEDLFYHELAHMWFGNKVTCSTAEDMWLNEGWATYCETIFREFVKGKPNALAFRRSSHETVLRYYQIEDGGFLALFPMDQSLTYSSTVYEKGGSVAHALRGYLGDDVFFPAITAFLADNAYESLSSIDFRDFLSAHTSIDMTDFFQDWVFTGGFVHYSIDSTQIVENGLNYDVTVYMKQKLRGRETFANSNRVEVTFMNDDFSTDTQMMQFDGEFGVQTFTVPFNPILVLCDYNEKMSDATIDETKIHTTIGTKTYNYDYFKANIQMINEVEPALLRITHNWAAPDTFKVAVPGLYIANHRYWTVEGNFPSTFKSKGEFAYSTSTTSSITGYLDYQFITNSLDSIVLLYRPDRATEWSIEPCINQTTMKKLTVDSLKNGEYSLGIYDWDAYTKTQQNIVVNNASVYPNPNNGEFYVSTGEKFIGEIKVTDITGKEVYQSKEKNESDYILINLGDLPDGLYIVTGKNRFSGKTFNRKFIVQK